MDSKIRALILAAAEDQARDLLWEDRQGDEELPKGAIEEAITAGQITPEEIVEAFRDQLLEELGG